MKSGGGQKNKNNNDKTHTQDNVANIAHKMRSGVYEYKANYENHADLAPSALYPYIRGALMAVAGEGEKENNLSVIEITENGVIEYNGTQKEVYPTLDEYFKQ